MPATTKGGASATTNPAPPSITLASGPDRSECGVFALGFVGNAGTAGQWTLGLGADETVEDLGIDPFELLDRADASGKGGEVVIHEVLGAGGDEPLRIVLVGLGDETARDYRRAGAAITRAAAGLGTAATPIGSLADDDQLAALVEGMVLGGFGFSRRSTDRSEDAVAIRLTDLAGGRRAVVEAAVVRAMASWRARSYALTPSNEKGPVQLEAWAREAADQGALRLDVWDDKRLEAEGFGGILAVGRGSAYASRMLRLDYRPRRRRGSVDATPHVVLVGKGITFDTGGLSLKPRVAMETMKRDMTGGAVVIAVMRALKDLGVTARVTGLVASAENAIGAAAMRPSDVVTHYGGRTSEIGNTDAEGRLVLADALAYAAEHLDATHVVDVATLTGAGKMALGTTLGALFANDDDLAVGLRDAGERAGEPVWRLPLFEEYEPLLNATFADATNAAGGPGAITAALFLQHFAGDTPWAHLDIASVGDSPVDAFEYSKGATGFGARLLLRWLAEL